MSYRENRRIGACRTCGNNMTICSCRKKTQFEEMRAKILEHFDTRIAAAQAEVDSFKPRSRPIELSPRQIEAFKLIGLTSETMSQRLGISKRSAVNLVTVIMEELNVPNRASAVLKAIKLGILKFEDFEIGERD